jgi:hypothetical protein
MSHGTEHHLEHAEHVQHATHNPFDRQVAMTMAIMAALLAGVTMVSHRGHNETLRLQAEANTFHTKSSDKWNYYQAKNLNSRQFQANLMMAMFLADKQDREAQEKEKAAMRLWKKQVDKYEGEGYWATQVATNFRGDERKDGTKLKGGQLAELQDEAKAYEKKAHDLEKISHHIHENVGWLDVGHLGLELALVFCSVAVLSKQRGLWYLGITVAVVGACLAGFGVCGTYLMDPVH